MASHFGAKVALTVQPGGVNSTFKGIDYQVKLMLLAVTKSFQNPNNTTFEVSSEIKETEPFDDVILKVSNDAPRFIQCKSKENPMVLNFEDFFDSRHKNFYLCKYFNGFVNIKKQFKKTGDFVICTNNFIPNTRTLLDETGKHKIAFLLVSERDEVFGNFSERYKIDPSCKTIIRRRLIQDLSTQWWNATGLVDKHLDEFLSNLLFIFDLKKEDIDKEIDSFIQNQFKLSVVDSPKSTLMYTLYSWIENMQTAKSINKKSFENYLRETKDKSELIPKAIDRSLSLFRTSKFEFKIPTNVSDFMRKFKSGPNQLFYMQTEKGDTFQGSCMINQELNVKTSDELLFLSTCSPFDIEDGLKIFPMENCFNFLIFVESREKPIQDRHKKQFKSILVKNPSKRVLIVTDQNKLQFATDIIVNDENLLTIQEIKLSDLTKQSLDRFLNKREIKLQNENVKLKFLLNSSDQSLIDVINVRDLNEIQSIGGDVVNDKKFDSNLYIERKLLNRNVIKREILVSTSSDKFVTDELTFESICNQFPGENVHWLEPRSDGNDLIWKKSQGKIDFLFGFVDPEQGTSIQDPWNSAVAADRTFILSDIAGMGKSSYLNHVAQILKKKHKDHFIVNICLNDYTEYYQDHKFKDEESVLKFFESEVLKLHEDIQKQLFRAACKIGKVKVILDGFDEVYVESEPDVLKLFEMVGRMQISGLYISTRLELKGILEQKMQNFGHEFVPFSQEDQQIFMIKFWSKDRQGNLSDDDLRMAAEKVVSVVVNRQLTEITGIPLITRMVAEIFDSEMLAEIIQNTSIVEDKISNLLHLYRDFVDKNIERYLIEKLGHDMSKRGNKRIARSEKQKMITHYKKMALKLILPQFFNFFYGNFEFTLDELEEMEKCGLCDSNGRFMHRTIAEYFVSLILHENFNNPEISKFLIQDLLSAEKFRVIRSFLNISIENCSDSWKMYGKILMESEDKFKKSLDMACQEHNANILKFFFESLFAMKSETAKELVLGILDQKFLNFYIINVNDNLKIFQLVEREFGLETLRNFLVTDNFVILKSSVRSPVNCQLLLSTMRQKFNDTEFWEYFRELSNEFLTEILKRMPPNLTKEIFNEIYQIELDKKICCFETFSGFGTNSTFDSIAVDFLSYLIDVKGFQVIMKVMFVNGRNMEDEYSEADIHYLHLRSYFTLIECSRHSQLIDTLTKIVYRQLLGKSKCQSKIYYQKIRENLMLEKLKIDLSEKDLNELRSLPEIFKIDAENVEFVHETAISVFSFLFLKRNFSDPQVIQIFFYDFLESDNLDNFFYDFCLFLMPKLELLGRFVFDYLNYENDLDLQECPMTAKNFFMKLRQKKVLGFYSPNPLGEFLYFLLHAMIFAINSEEDRKKFNMILLFKDEKQQIFQWSGYFIGFWQHCQAMFAPNFDFYLKFDSTVREEHGFEVQDQRMVSKLCDWIVGKYGKDHHALDYQDANGINVLKYLECIRSHPFFLSMEDVISIIIGSKVSGSEPLSDSD